MNEENVYTFNVLNDGHAEQVDIYAKDINNAYYKLSLIEKARNIQYIPEQYARLYFRGY